MENRNSIAGNIPVASQSKAALTNSLDRPLSFTEVSLFKLSTTEM